jgi:NitT/TauT family transport system substrate-binding protein
MPTRVSRVSRLLLAAAIVCLTSIPARAQDAPTKVSVAILFLAADVGIFLGIERGYFAEQKLDVQLSRITSGADAIALLATDQLNIGSGGPTPGLFNAFKRGVPIQIVSEKSSLRPPLGLGPGRLLVRKDLMDSGEIKTIAQLKGKRIAVNSLQSTSLNYVLRSIAPGGLTKDDVTLVEMPFSQFIPAFQKKAIDGAMAYTPFLQTIAENMKLASIMPGTDLEKSSAGDSINLMMYSPDFAKTDAAKRFMVAHLKGQREFQRVLEGKAGDKLEICRVINKYVPSMPADCKGLSFTGIDPNGGVNVESLERYQKEWLSWGVMKEPADIRKHVNLDFARNAVSVLGPYR